MSESTIKIKRRQIRRDGYISKQEKSRRHWLIVEKKSKFIWDLMKKILS